MTRIRRPHACPRAPLARPLILAILGLAALAVLPAPARAQEQYNYTFSALGGIGGSPDPSRGNGFDNHGLQINLGMVTQPHTHLDLRLGSLKLDADDSFGSLTDAELAYVTIGGEYRFPETYYQSGVFIALGGYRLEGTDPGGSSQEDTAIGGALGFTGEFEINHHLGVLVELSGHYADLDEAQFFGMAHVGLSLHF